MRKIVRLMKNWQFIGPEGNTTPVDLPHTWNAIDGQDGALQDHGGNQAYRELQHLPHQLCGPGL